MPEAPAGYCYHQEKIDTRTYIGVCGLCGRTVQYNREKPLLPPEVIIPGLPLPPREKGRKYESNTWPRAPKEVTVVETKEKEITPKDQAWFDLAEEKQKEYFDRHKEELVADLVNLSYAQMLEKWGITAYQVASLKRYFGLPMKRYKQYNRKKSEASDGPDPKDPGAETTGPDSRKPAGAITAGKLSQKLQALESRLEELEDQADKDKPPLPAFNEAWGDSVKVAWLEARRQI